MNRARVRSQGVEITARWQPHETLWLTAEVTYLDADGPVGRPGAASLRAPLARRRDASPGSPSPELSLRLDARAVSHYLDNQIPVPDQDTVPAYGLFGFAGSWRFHRGWSVRARVDNLADRRYETLHRLPRGTARLLARRWAGIDS